MESHRTKNRVVLSILKGLWIYCLILWAYIVADMFVFPEYQFLGISMLIPIPENFLADIAFPVSFVSFIAWDYLKNRQS